MEELAKHLARTALLEGAVASQLLEGGMCMLAYPMGDGVLVGLGYNPDLAGRVRMDVLLRRRAADPARYGAWLPARFSDGSCYLVRRVIGANGGADTGSLDTIVSAELLSAAQELLS